MTAMLLAAVLAGTAGCGDDGGKPQAAAADPGVERVSAACAEYRKAARAELPPAEPAGYATYLRDQQELAERFASQVRDAPVSQRVRGRLLAATANLVGQFNDTGRTTEGDNFAGGMYGRGGTIARFEREFDAATVKAGVRCGVPGPPSAPLKAFHAEVAAACDRSGRAKGTPGLDAELLRRRADEHGRLEVPEDAGLAALEVIGEEEVLAELAADRRRAKRIRTADAEYVALATRVSTGWSRLGVVACTELPEGDW